MSRKLQLGLTLMIVGWLCLLVGFVLAPSWWLAVYLLAWIPVWLWFFRFGRRHRGM